MSEQSTVNSHPVWALLSRYRAIFAAAWAARHELAGPARLADEAAFLPAALSLQATPVHPAPRRATWVICILFVIALLWASFGELDIVAVAPGRIVVSDGSKLIQPLEASVVKAIHVQDGDHVKAGQLLIELDGTTANADHSRVIDDRTAAVSEHTRTSALLAALAKGGEPRLAADPELQADDRLAAEAQLRSEWADISAKLSRLQAEVAKHRAEGQTVDQQIDKLETTVPLARQRESDFSTLQSQGFIAGHASQDRTRERIELEKDLNMLRARKVETLAAQNESQQAYAAQQAETVRTLQERKSQAQLKRLELGNEAVKAGQKMRLTQLTAPVDGTVQQLAIHTSGGVVTPAQTLLVVVPDRAEVTAEVMLENKDIGFVKAGQHVEVKLETFPYTRYGTVGATVTHMAADAVVVSAERRNPADNNKLNDGASSQANAAGAGFPATLTLVQHDVNVDGTRVRLSPGMNLTAEIMIGRRRVIDYLLSPVREHLNDSLRER